MFDNNRLINLEFHEKQKFENLWVAVWIEDNKIIKLSTP